MSRKNVARLADLKRAGFPFDPTRPANWFAGILRSLLARNHPTDRVDLLAKQTLKQMNILTKGERRGFILTQVEYAIKQLCDRKILLPYGQEQRRVRLWDGLPQTKLERYLNDKPIPWETVSLPDRNRPDIHRSEPGNDPELGRNGTRGLFDEPIPTLPELSSPVDPVSPDEGSTPIRWTPPPPPLPDTWRQEEDEMFGTLLQSDCTNASEPPIGATAPPLGDEISAFGTVDRAMGMFPLEDIVTAIREKGESVTVFSRREREAVFTLSHGDQIELMWRRGGELRVFVRFPEGELTRVLRHIGARWIDMVVALDRHGRCGIQRTIPADTSSLSVATILLRDVQELEDAIATVQ